jgi:dienelactone hydrolase
LAAFCKTGVAQDKAATVEAVDGRVYTVDADKKRLAGMWSADLRHRRGAAHERDAYAWGQIQSRAEWEKSRDVRLAALRRSLGTPTEVPASLNVQVTGTVRGKGYTIENLVFESRPGLLVTANLYRPPEPAEKMPGILICHSHHSPKSQSELQEMGALWARQGCLVLVMDQLGHGERRQHPFRSKDDYAGEFRPGRQDYYFRYNVGLQLHTIGESLVGWMAWDLMRGVDLLLARPGIDPRRIILLGAVAGGGDPAAVTAALDTRIAAAVPFNFGGPQPETTYPLPPNAERVFNYLGGGSWESTRNLRLSARDGFAPWVIVGAIAPRRLVYAHEFAWDREHDPVWKRLEKIYGFYGAADGLDATHGEGSVRGSGPGNTHCNNIGPEHLVAIHAACERWFQIAVPRREDLPRHSAEELTCLTAAAAARPRAIHDLAREIGAARAAAARNRLAQLNPADRRQELHRSWTGLLGTIEPDRDPQVITAQAATLERIGKPVPIDATLERLALEVEPGIVVPLVLLAPVKATPGPRPVVVAVAQAGKQVFLDQRAEAIAELLSAGVAVCLPDLRGTGETKPDDGRGRGSSATSLSSEELMFGQTALGARVRDLRSVLKYLRTRPEFDARRLGLWGDSFATANPRDRTFAVPLDAGDPPAISEPLGGLAVLLTALFEEEIRAVSARGGLISFESLLESPFVCVPHDVIVPGALTAGDVVDVAAALAPLPLQISDVVDGLNRLATTDEAAAALAPVRRAYGAQAGAWLSLPGAEPVATANWLRQALAD